MNPGVQRLVERFYHRKKGWVDGTSAFASLVQARTAAWMRVLDLGAGKGKEGPVNFRGKVAEVVGIDCDPVVLKNPYLDEAIVGRVEDLPFRESSFDLVYADWVLEHLPDPYAMAKEVVRVLKPGGCFCFRTGNLYHYAFFIAALTPYRVHKRLANWARGMADAQDAPFPAHYRMNTVGKIRTVLSRVGLQEEALCLLEPEPAYLMFSVPSFLLGVAYERIVNRFPNLACLRSTILGSFRKPVL
jgi:SAM-dependent methyltransferase